MLLWKRYNVILWFVSVSLLCTSYLKKASCTQRFNSVHSFLCFGVSASSSSQGYVDTFYREWNGHLYSNGKAKYNNIFWMTHESFQCNFQGLCCSGRRHIYHSRIVHSPTSFPDWISKVRWLRNTLTHQLIQTTRSNNIITCQFIPLSLPYWTAPMNIANNYMLADPLTRSVVLYSSLDELILFSCSLCAVASLVSVWADNCPWT